MRLALQPRSKCAFWAGHGVDISDYHNRLSGKKKKGKRKRTTNNLYFEEKLVE